MLCKNSVYLLIVKHFVVRQMVSEEVAMLFCSWNSQNWSMQKKCLLLFIVFVFADIGNGCLSGLCGFDMIFWLLGNIRALTTINEIEIDGDWLMEWSGCLEYRDPGHERLTSRRPRRTFSWNICPRLDGISTAKQITQARASKCSIAISKNKINLRKIRQMPGNARRFSFPVYATHSLTKFGCLRHANRLLAIGRMLDASAVCVYRRLWLIEMFDVKTVSARSTFSSMKFQSRHFQEFLLNEVFDIGTSSAKVHSAECQSDYAELNCTLNQNHSETMKMNDELCTFWWWFENEIPRYQIVNSNME